MGRDNKLHYYIYEYFSYPVSPFFYTKLQEEFINPTFAA